jgi:hypothetical protein
MAYAYALLASVPAGSRLVSLGDDDIREFKSALIERVQSFFANIENDPWQVKTGATFLGTASFAGLVDITRSVGPLMSMNITAAGAILAEQLYRSSIIKWNRQLDATDNLVFTNAAGSSVLTLAQSNSVFVGADPGGSESLRVGGSIRLAQDIIGADSKALFNVGTGVGDLRLFWSATSAIIRSGTQAVVIQKNDGSVHSQFSNVGAFIVGADPGGVETLRVGGGLRANAASIIGPVLSVGLGYTTLDGSQIIVTETAHATSRRSAIQFGNWIIGQDSGVNGTRDFFFWDAAAGFRGFIGVSGALVWGNDPGGTEKLRIGGDARIDRIYNDNARTNLDLVSTGTVGALRFFTQNLLRVAIGSLGDVIIGADPGGSEMLRVGGNARFSSNILVSHISTINDQSAYLANATKDFTLATVSHYIVTINGTVNSLQYWFGRVYCDNVGNLQFFPEATSAITFTQAAANTARVTNSGTPQDIQVRLLRVG